MRPLDFTVGMLGTSLLGPPLAALSAVGLRFNVAKTLVVGQGARLFFRRRLEFRPGPLSSLAGRLGLAHLPDCVALMRGDLALVGPRPLELMAAHAVAFYRVSVRPGLISPYRPGQRAFVVCDTEDAADFAYATGRLGVSDTAILLRALRFRMTHSDRSKAWTGASAALPKKVMSGKTQPSAG